MTEMERFWDERAREDAFYFVDSRLRYSHPDESAFWSGGDEALQALLTALDAELPADAVVVDIGCGLGRLTRPLARQVRRVLAIDVSEEMLTRAQQLNPQLDNVEWLHGDGQSLRPVGDGAADACISHVVFRHIPDPAVTLGYVREMGRVLRPGGIAAFEFSNDAGLHRRGRMSLRGRIAAALGRAPRGQSAAPWVGSSLDVDALRAAADEGGLDVIRVTGKSTEFCAALLRRRPPA